MTTNIANCNFTYELVNKTMSFQRFCNLSLQIKTYDHLWLTAPTRMAVKRKNQYGGEQDEAVFIRTEQCKEAIAK